MQSHQDTFGSDALKNRGHRRSDTLGKSMPITSLLLNYTPSRLQISANIRSDGGTGNTSPTQQELPPLFFPIHDESANHDKETLRKSSEVQKLNLDTDDDLDILEQEYEILVSECSSSNGESDQEGDRRKSNSEEYISLIGNSKFYTPCLTCVGSAPTELASRPSAINEMCRRLCTEECRLRLSLAGLVIPSEKISNNRKLLEEYVKDSLERPVDEIYDTPPKLPPRPVKKFEGTKLTLEAKPPALPLRPPGNIAIQRKKFLTHMLMQAANISSDDEDDLDKQQPPKELLDIVTSIVVPPSLPPVATTTSSVSSDVLNVGETHENIKIDPHELEMLKDFREKFEIAEALAKTSAMTSTSKIKQRLAARKLEIEMENAKALATATKHKNKKNITENTHASSNTTSARGVDDNKYKQQTGLASIYIADDGDDDDDNGGNAGSNFSTGNAQGVPDAVTKQQNLSHTILDSMSPYYDNEYEPPRELLLYLVR